MDIFLRMIQYVKINLFSHILMIKRTVPVWNHITGLSPESAFLDRQIFFIILRAAFPEIPHLQEHHGEALYRISFQHNRGIFPMTKPQLLIDIFISQIDPTGKRNFSIDHTDLSVIPVILTGGHNRFNRRELLALDSHFPELFRILIWKQGNTAHTVIHETDFHTFLYLLLQNIQN